MTDYQDYCAHHEETDPGKWSYRGYCRVKPKYLVVNPNKEEWAFHEKVCGQHLSLEVRYLIEVENLAEVVVKPLTRG